MYGMDHASKEVLFVSILRVFCWLSALALYAVAADFKPPRKGCGFLPPQGLALNAIQVR